eukprot:TRINITY_DN7213_c0_g1_i1.p1 TRINITY_DN7213_c0_g1~~TRINITY_DN7213_c0_g1_i1.p1  ORF type:complete len:592 (-),score=35.01 TRINITY_DN7213_c0_g1_i1:312-2087(-)
MESILMRRAVLILLATAVVNAVDCATRDECFRDDPIADVSLLQAMIEVQTLRLDTPANMSSGRVNKTQEWYSPYNLVFGTEVGMNTVRHFDAHSFAHLNRGSTYLVIGVVLCMFILIASHECCLWRGINSPSSAPSSSKFVGFQFSGLAITFASFVVFIDSSVVNTFVIPTSYDLAISCGFNAAASGVLVCICVIGTLPGAIAAKKWLDEDAGYSQRRARSGLLLGACLSIFGTLLFGVACLLLDGKLLFRTLCAIRVVQGLGCGFAIIIPPIVAFRAVRPEQRKMATMCMAIGQNLGVVMGPLVSAVALSSRALMVTPDTAKSLDSSSPEERAMWAAFGTAFYSFATSCIVLLVIPVELPEIEEGVDENKSTNSQTEHELASLSEEDKSLLYYWTNWYKVERGFIIAAIEVSTLMLLEEKYGWSVQDSSYVFSCVAVGSSVLTVISLALMQQGLITDFTMYGIGLVCVGLSAALFFDIGGLPTLLVADFLVYGFSSTCQGIADFWGMSVASMLGEGFTLAKWRVIGAMGITIMRLVSPPLARTLCDTGSRNGYAAVQAMIVLFGMLTGVKLYRARRRCQLTHKVLGTRTG